MNRLMHVSSAGVLLILAVLLGSPGCGCGGDVGLTGLSSLPVSIVYAGEGYDGPDGIHVIDVNTMTLVTTIANAGGYRMVLSLDGSKIYSTGGTETFYISNATTNTLITSYDPATFFADTSSELEAIAMNPAGTRVYVFDEQGDADLFVIDTATDLPILNAFDVASPFSEPENVFVDPTGSFLIMADNSDIWKIDIGTLTVLGSVPSGGDAHGVNMRLDGTRAFYQGVTGGIDVLDTAGAMAFVTNIPNPACTGSCGYYVEHAKVGTRVYEVDESDNLGVYDSTTNTLITNVTLSTGSARGVTTTSDGSTILVATDSGLIKINAVTLLETGFLAGSFQSVITP